jgi:hypothetical protein
VLFGSQICVRSEPTDVLCLDRATGAVRWRASNQFLDSVSAADRPFWEGLLTTARAQQSELDALQRQYSALQREARKGDAAAAASLVTTSQQLSTLKESVDAFKPYFTDQERSILGYSTETPVTDGRSLFVLSGNGVISRFEADGRRTWSTWLGAAPAKMVGFDTGTSASPLLVDGLLIAPFGRLRALNPATGSTVWIGKAYGHYGTPGVGTWNGEAALLLPDGSAIRVRDGKELSRGHGDVWFTGPAASGSAAVWWGGHSGNDIQRAGASLRAWNFAGSTPTQLWSTTIPLKFAVYHAPVTLSDQLWLTSEGGDLIIVNGSDGAVVHRADLKTIAKGAHYPGPIAAGGFVYETDDQGNTVVIRATPPYDVIATNHLEPGRAAPIVADGRFYYRGTTRLWAVGG